MMKTKKSGKISQEIIDHFEPEHEYYIHDVKYDYYGQRMATCSSDHKIKIWDISYDNQNNKKWVCTDEWKGHDGSIWKIDWAHPEFGQIIASCSFDGSVCIWEETRVKEKNVTKRKWNKQRRFFEASQENVCDIKFAPNHFGLKLSTCSLDGIIRIYNAPNVMDVSVWETQSQFTNCEKGSTCIDWNKSVLDEAMIVVGAMDGTVKIWKFEKQQHRWNMIKELVEKKKSSSTNIEPVHDVSWAPCMGRTYHLIACVTKNGVINIWKITRDKENKTMLKSELMGKLNDFHKGEVWSVQWNITGSILATSGDDGYVCLFKYMPNDKKWNCVKRVSQ